MNHRTLGRDGLDVSALGLGCMGMSEFYGPTDDDESIRTIHRAIDLGVTFLDTADMYGIGANEQLVGDGDRRPPRRASCSRRSSASSARRASRGASTPARSTPSRPARRRCAGSASTTSTSTTCIAATPASRSRRPSAGWRSSSTRARSGYIGLSEVIADTLRAACAVHPIAALQSEWSLWTRGIEAEIVPAARELGVGIVPYSPVGRGFLTGALRVDRRPLRRRLPPLQPALSGRQPRGEPHDRRARARGRRRRRLHARPARARVAAASGRRRRPDPRHEARALRRGERRGRRHQPHRRPSRARSTRRCRSASRPASATPTRRWAPSSSRRCPARVVVGDPRRVAARLDGPSRALAARCSPRGAKRGWVRGI